MMNDYAKLYKYLWLHIYDDNEDHWLIRHEADAESWDKPTAIRQLQEFLAWCSDAGVVISETNIPNNLKPVWNEIRQTVLPA